MTAEVVFISMDLQKPWHGMGRRRSARELPTVEDTADFGNHGVVMLPIYNVVGIKTTTQGYHQVGKNVHLGLGTYERQVFPPHT